MPARATQAERLGHPTEATDALTRNAPTSAHNRRKLVSKPFSIGPRTAVRTGRLARLRVNCAVVQPARRCRPSGQTSDRAYPGLESMKVIDGLTAVAPGATVSVSELGLPVSGGQAVLLVFWKST